MPRQEREAHQEQEQVGEDHPFVLEVQAEAGEAGAVFEAGEQELVERDGREPGERDCERVMVEQGDPEQGQAEQDEVDRDAEDIDRRARGLAGRRRGRGGDEAERQRENEAGIAPSMGAIRPPRTVGKRASARPLRGRSAEGRRPRARAKPQGEHRG